MEMTTNRPTPASEREIFMDVLRGFAILGIFIANLAGFSFYRESAHETGPLLLPALDHQMEFLHHLFIEGKFYSIFSLLFGWGLALQFKRAEAKGIDGLPTIRRRLFFMLILGALHLLIWPGDIVFFYAMLGFIFLPLRKFSNRTLLITAGVLVLLPIALYAAKMHWQWVNAPAGIMYMTGEHVGKALTGVGSEAAYINFLKTAGWWEVLLGDMSGFFFRYGYLFFVSRIPKVIALFCIGYVLGRSGFYQKIQQHQKTLYLTIVIGLLMGLPANFYLARYMSYFMDDYWNLKMNGLYQTIAYALGVMPLALAYVALMMLIFQTNLGKRILSVLAPVGKMAFSNYIMHSLIGNFVFLGAGLGYIGKVGPVYFTLFGIAVFMVQIVLSSLWLRYFNYGPLEWLWRSATYKKWQPLIRVNQHVH